MGSQDVTTFEQTHSIKSDGFGTSVISSGQARAGPVVGAGHQRPRIRRCEEVTQRSLSVCSPLRGHLPTAKKPEFVGGSF